MLPALYHEHHSHHMEDLPLWVNLARRYGSPILELGCGTGRILINLAREDYVVYGLDSNLDMLSFLIGNLPGDLHDHAHVFQADMASFRLAKRFPLIILPCNTLSTLSREERSSTFSRVREHLLLGGVFVASIPNPNILLNLPEEGESDLEEIFHHRTSGNPVQVSSSWRRLRGVLTIKWSYDLLFPDGRVQRVVAMISHQLDPVSVYKRELKAQGMECVNEYGDYDLSKFRPDSTYWICVAGLMPLTEGRGDSKS